MFREVASHACRSKMEPFRIVKYGNPVLRVVCKPVSFIGQDIKRLVARMEATLEKADGVGLAAPQVGCPLRVFITRLDQAVVDGLKPEQRFQSFIDPELIFLDGNCVFEEGCLSIPEVYEDVERAERVRMRFRNLQNEICEAEFSGLAARIVLHECDHLDGKLFIDYLGSFRLNRLKKKLSAIQEEEQKLIRLSSEA